MLKLSNKCRQKTENVDIQTKLKLLRFGLFLIGCQNNLWVKRGGQMRKKYYDDAKENVAFERCGCCDIADLKIWIGIKKEMDFT